MRLEKGIKGIETNISRQEVTLTYDADKTTPEKLIKGFEKSDTLRQRRQTITNNRQFATRNKIAVRMDRKDATRNKENAKIS